jgi:hypothetical protein
VALPLAKCILLALCVSRDLVGLSKGLAPSAVSGHVMARLSDCARA